MSKLLPCAHCGGKAKVFQAYDGLHCVQCLTCGMTTLYGRRCDVEQIWNTRATKESEVTI